MKSQDLVDNINTKWIFDRLKSKLSNEFDIKWILNTHGVFRYYTVGDYFLEHKDNVNKSGADPRYFTVTVQLSEADEYEGGDLEYWQGGKQPIVAHRGAGSVFIFPSYMMHRVTTVTKGTRKSFVLWVGGTHYR